MLALFRMNGVRTHITDDKPSPDKAKPDLVTDWEAKEIVLGILEMYCQKDVWTMVLDDSKFDTCKAKWVEIKRIYGGVGSMSSFNTWVALTSTALDESTLMLPQ